MSSRTSGWLSCLAIVLTLSGSAPRASTIAFVDFDRVLAQISKTKEVTDELEERTRALRRKGQLLTQEFEAELQRLQEEERQEQLAGGELLVQARNRYRRRYELREQKVKNDAEIETASLDIQSRFVRHKKDTFLLVRKACEDIARREGYTAVFMKRDGEPEGVRAEEVSANIITRPVLWSASSADITARVIEKLNQ